jgi:hypothetical protein
MEWCRSGNDGVVLTGADREAQAVLMESAYAFRTIGFHSGMHHPKPVNLSHMVDYFGFGVVE